MTDIAHMISGRFFGIIQNYIIELRLFEFVTTKETEKMYDTGNIDARN